MSKRILVVDDEAHIVQVLSLKLRNAGYDVLTARDGEEGLEVAAASAPDLIIADFQMPYMTGLELCRALAAQPGTAHTPVIILTARGYALDDEDLKIGNIRTVLSKPFSPRGILQEVKNVLDRQDRASGAELSALDGTGHVASAGRNVSRDIARHPAPGAGHSGPRGEREEAA